MFGAFLSALPFAMLFTIPEFSTQTITSAYVLGVLVLYTLGYTIFNVPYMAMPAEMTDGYHERSSLHSYRVVFISVGSSVAGALAPILLQVFGEGREAYRVVAILFAGIIFASMVACYFGTRDARFTYFLTSTFTFDTAEAGGEIFAGLREGHIYSRISNPTLDLVERRIADLEGAEAALSTASGMGAITSLLWTLLTPGDEIIVDTTLYGCTFAFLHHGLARFGVIVTHVDLTVPENLSHAISHRTRAVFFETPANPNMRLVDIQAVSRIAREAGAMTIVDNTYATPVCTRPLGLGADFVVHSATKYLGGHGDLVAGVVLGTAKDIAQVRMVGVKDMTGAVLAPFNAMLLLRGLKTLTLRMQRHCENALTVARWLAEHPLVATVHYPGLEQFEWHDLACRQMDGFGGMIAFELHGGCPAGVDLINRLRLIQRAVSLGDAESLIQHPASMTHSTYTPAERAVHGISDGLIRLSVGLEDVDDLLADLDQAFQKGLRA